MNKIIQKSEYSRLGNKKIVNPLTAYLYFEKGMTLEGWCRVNGLSYGMMNHVINGGLYNAGIVPALREQGLYEKLPVAVRRLIEADEIKREAKQNDSTSV